MPIIKSAIKRVRQEARRQKRNTATKNTYKDLIKQVMLLIDANKLAEASKLLPKVQKSIDMAVKKNLMHRNTAARKKSNLAKKVSPAKTTAPKEAAKPAAKKAA